MQGRAEETRRAFKTYVELAEALVEHTAGNAEASSKATLEFDRPFGAQDPVSMVEVRALRGEVDAAFALLDN